MKTEFEEFADSYALSYYGDIDAMGLSKKELIILGESYKKHSLKPFLNLIRRINSLKNIIVPAPDTVNEENKHEAEAISGIFVVIEDFIKKHKIDERN